VEGIFGLTRGEIWTVSGGADYTGKPRPAVIVQSNLFDAIPSITVCPFSGALFDAEPARFAVAPSQSNGLKATSQVMVDKISTVPKSKVGYRIGHLDASDIRLLDQHLAVFLGLAD
jgi:mRNA interferase MazF